MVTPNLDARIASQMHALLCPQSGTYPRTQDPCICSRGKMDAELSLLKQKAALADELATCVEELVSRCQEKIDDDIKHYGEHAARAARWIEPQIGMAAFDDCREILHRYTAIEKGGE
jgi:hypothetical protein